MLFSNSRRLQDRIHDIVPGGCHTYAKGDDQFPQNSPGFIVRGKGSHVWDADDNEFIEYGMGCRAVTLGHAYEPILDAAMRAMQDGANFTRPSVLELECAEMLLSLIPGAEMVKFAKDGSATTTAAFKLARAFTGRDMIAVCADHPFFATNDWFIGSTEINSGITADVVRRTVKFRYNDPESLQHVFRDYPDQIACVILEPAKYSEPEDDFLHRTKELCHEHGAVFVLDEMITGFRWHNGGAQTLYGIEPDLSTFGKAIGNGFSLSALTGKRELMEVGGLYHDRDRLFLLSTTHGAETHCLAAAIAVMETYLNSPVVERLHEQGQKLCRGTSEVIRQHRLSDYVQVVGRPCNLVFVTRDQTGTPSQGFRALLMQELIKCGVLGPSLVVSYSHSDRDIQETILAFDRALSVYSAALVEGYEAHLVGAPTQTVYRKRNTPEFACRRPSESTN